MAKHNNMREKANNNHVVNDKMLCLCKQSIISSLNLSLSFYCIVVGNISFADQIAPNATNKSISTCLMRAFHYRRQQLIKVCDKGRQYERKQQPEFK